MAGQVIPVNGTVECLARLALTDSGGKWAPGTVLELYPLDWPLNWGDQAHFLLIRAVLSEEQAALVPQRELMIPLDSFLSEESIESYRRNLSMKQADFLASGEKPRLDAAVDGKNLAQASPPEQWAHLTPESE